MEDQNLLSAAEAALILGKSDRQIRRLCEAGKLDHTKNGKAYLVSRESVERLLQEMPETSETEGETQISLPTNSGSDVHSENEAETQVKASPAHSPRGSDMPQPESDILRTSDTPSNGCPDIPELTKALEAARQNQHALFNVAEELFRHLQSQAEASSKLRDGLSKMLPSAPAQASSRPRWVRQAKILLPWLVSGASLLALGLS